jgi:hypothetical protein
MAIRWTQHAGPSALMAGADVSGKTAADRPRPAISAARHGSSTCTKHAIGLPPSLRTLRESDCLKHELCMQQVRRPQQTLRGDESTRLRITYLVHIAALDFSRDIPTTLGRVLHPDPPHDPSPCLPRLRHLNVWHLGETVIQFLSCASALDSLAC